MIEFGGLFMKDYAYVTLPLSYTTLYYCTIQAGSPTTPFETAYHIYSLNNFKITITEKINIASVTWFAVGY